MKGIMGVTNPIALYYLMLGEENVTKDTILDMEKHLDTLTGLSQKEANDKQELWEVYIYLFYKKYGSAGLRYINLPTEQLGNYKFVREWYEPMGEFNDGRFLQTFINLFIDEEGLDVIDLTETDYQSVYETFKRFTGRKMYVKVFKEQAIRGADELERPDNYTVLYELGDAVNVLSQHKDIPYKDTQYLESNTRVRDKTQWVIDGLVLYLNIQ